MVRKIVVATLLAVGMIPFIPQEADAGYTVYIYNTRRREGWIRTGFTHDLNKSWQACIKSVQNRIAENRRYRTDFEAYAIVYTTQTPPAGRYRGGRGWIVYRPR